MKTIKFTACKHLDFDDNYSAEKVLISGCGETKVCWDRPVVDESYPGLVQFCKKRGRMNKPELCTCEEKKGCSDYEDFNHEINLNTINLK